MISAMIRAWLRNVLDLNDLAGAIQEEKVRRGIAQREIIKRLEACEKEIESLKYMKAQREAKAHARQITDWERIQAEWAANPENFAAPKEN